MADFEAIQVSICDMFQKESDAREGMVPAAELRPTIDIIKSLLLSADCSWYQSGGGHDWKEAVDVARAEIARLETLLGEKGGK